MNLSLPARFLAASFVPLLAAGPSAWCAAEGTVAAKPVGRPLDADLPVELAVLTEAPHVPPPITRRHPAKVIVNREVREVVKRLADGVEYTFWTHGGKDRRHRQPLRHCLK